MAAEGSDYFGYDDSHLDDKIDHDNGNDDEKEGNRTRPFQPGTVSTPYHRGKEHEMQNMQKENSRLPDTSYEESPLLSRSDSKNEKSC